MYSRQLDSFVRAAEAGSFTKAARQLYIAPTSLIQQVSLLEARLGVTLFDRGPRGVSLTPAGASLYRDAIDVIERSHAAVDRARRIQDGGASIRVGTSLLMKCRMLPGFWAQMVEEHPGTKIELVALGNPEGAGYEPLSSLGKGIDLQEGLYLSEYYRGRCEFLELTRCPILPAVPSRHPLSGRACLAAKDLRGSSVVLLKRGVSRDFDLVRDDLERAGVLDVIDAPYYDMSVFAQCEMRGHVLMTPAIWEDIHPALKVHQLRDARTCPYGIIYAKDPSPQTRRFLEVIGRSVPAASSARAAAVASPSARPAAAPAAPAAPA